MIQIGNVINAIAARAIGVCAPCCERESRVAQLQLFARDLPEGFVYRLEFISAEEEQTLVGRIAQLSFAQIKMHGAMAKRRAAHFGRSYEYESGRIAHGAASGPSWDCGYARPTARMQYTASSFADTLVALFGWALRPTEDRPRPRGPFPSLHALPFAFAG